MPSGPARSDGAVATPGLSDDELRARTGAVEAELIVAYRAALAVLEDPPARVERFLAHHVQHLTTVAPGYPMPTDGAGSPRPAPTVTDLAQLEVWARQQHEAACDAAVDPALARDLCLIAASEAQHESRLRALAPRSGAGG